MRTENEGKSSQKLGTAVTVFFSVRELATCGFPSALLEDSIVRDFKNRLNQRSEDVEILARTCSPLLLQAKYIHYIPEVSKKVDLYSSIAHHHKTSNVLDASVCRK